MYTEATCRFNLLPIFVKAAWNLPFHTFKSCSNVEHFVKFKWIELLSVARDRNENEIRTDVSTIRSSFLKILLLENLHFNCFGNSSKLKRMIIFRE